MAEGQATRTTQILALYRHCLSTEAKWEVDS